MHLCAGHFFQLRVTDFIPIDWPVELIGGGWCLVHASAKHKVTRWGFASFSLGPASNNAKTILIPTRASEKPFWTENPERHPCYPGV